MYFFPKLLAPRDVLPCILEVMYGSLWATDIHSLVPLTNGLIPLSELSTLVSINSSAGGRFQGLIAHRVKGWFFLLSLLNAPLFLDLYSHLYTTLFGDSRWLRPHYSASLGDLVFYERWKKKFSPQLFWAAFFFFFYVHLRPVFHWTDLFFFFW